MNTKDVVDFLIKRINKEEDYTGLAKLLGDEIAKSGEDSFWRSASEMLIASEIAYIVETRAVDDRTCAALVSFAGQKYTDIEKDIAELGEDSVAARLFGLFRSFVSGSTGESVAIVVASKLSRIR